jgi:predicted Zn-dependent protease
MGLSRRHFLGGTAACSGLALCGCSQNAATGRSLFTPLAGSIENDIAVGRQEHPKLVKAFGGVYDDPKLQRYVDQIGARLAAQSEYPDLPFTFTIANSSIVNAFALPGGPVTITRGLLALADSEAELASVLGHEIGHVTARHTAERQGRQLLAQLGLAGIAIATGSQQVADLAGYGASAFLQSYSRSQEMEADSLGARYIERAGYEVDTMVTFLDSLHEQSKVEAAMLGLDPGTVDEFNMMATHPRTQDRVEAAMRIAAASADRQGVVNREVYLNAVNGLLFGDDPSQGIITGRHFAHPELRFEFTVPEGFRLINAEANVVARDQDGDLIVFDMARIGSADLRDYITREWAEKTSVSGLQAITVNGMEGATGAVRGQVNGTVMDIQLVAVRKDSARVYRFMFASLPNRTAALREDYRRTTYSLRALTPAEAAEIKPLRLVVTRVRPGETVDALAAALPYGKWNDDWFRLLNNLDKGQGVTSGDIVKMVLARA